MKIEIVSTGITNDLLIGATGGISLLCFQEEGSDWEQYAPGDGFIQIISAPLIPPSN